MAKARVAVLISGRGSNMAALVYAAKHSECPFEIVLVASNDPDAAGLALAQAEGIATFAQSHKGLKRAAFDAIINEALQKAQAECVALAGYMRLLSEGFVDAWQGRMLNIHPSLLPQYKGLDTHERALEAGDTVTGCSVHEVTAQLDAGMVLGQTEVAILAGDTPETLAARVLIAEHQLYPRVLAAYVARETSPDHLTAQVRARALALPQSDERVSHGMPCFGVLKGKKFAYVSHDHHGDGKTALLVKISGIDEQAMLIEQDGERYYRPAYFGDGWIGIRLDLGDNDWDSISNRLKTSWEASAPKSVMRALNIAETF
jgi:phosphoribosylglycinamide formyltransferase 1